MPWFEFTDDFRHVENAARVVMYSKGVTRFVTQGLADEASAKGKGHEIPRPAGMKAGKNGEPVSVEVEEPEITQAFITDVPEALEDTANGDNEGS